LGLVQDVAFAPSKEQANTAFVFVSVKVNVADVEL
jgi:hypothetical protein